MEAVVEMRTVLARLQVVLRVLQLVRVQLRQMLVAQEKKTVLVVLRATGAVAVVVVLDQPEQRL
jgi:Holliday junction resolvasome RuvABC endonuclease subunit